MVIPLAYKTAIINAAASGDRVVVPAAGAGVKIQLHAYVLYTDGTGGDFRWEDGGGGTALSGVFVMPAGAVIVVPFSEVPWLSTSANTALSMEIGLGEMDGHVIYSESP